MTSLNSFVSFSTLNISTRKTNTACVNHLSRSSGSSGQINAEEGKYYTSDMVEEYLDVSERVYLTVFFF